MNRKLVAYLPLLIWMALIFFASTEAGSPRRTSRIIGPILRWFNPEITDETVGAIQLAIRKTAHAVEYGMLALFAWWARSYESGQVLEWSSRRAAGVVLFCALYAVTDEAHQHFVSSRNASAGDVLLDTLGAAAFLLALWLALRIRARFLARRLGPVPG